LWELQPEQILGTEQYALWPLAGVMGADVTKDSFEGVAQQMIQAPVTHRQVAELVGELAAIGELRLPLGAFLEVLRRNPVIEDLLRDSSFTELVAEVLRPEIKAEALAEGRAEGRAEAARDLAKAALAERFKPLPADLLAVINTADEEKLRAVVIHSSESLDAVRARLGLAGK